MKTFIIGLIIGGVCGWILAAGQFNRYEVHASGPYNMSSTKLTGRTWERTIGDAAWRKVQDAADYAESQDIKAVTTYKPAK